MFNTLNIFPSQLNQFYLSYLICNLLPGNNHINKFSTTMCKSHFVTFRGIKNRKPVIF